MVILYFSILIIYSSLALFWPKQSKIVNLLGTLFLSIISLTMVMNLTKGMGLFWQGIDPLLIDDSLSMIGKVSMLAGSLFFFFMNVCQNKLDQIQIYPASSIGNFILLFSSGAVLFDSLIMFYFFYELVWLLLLFLLGLLFYQEKGSLYRVLINVMFGTTLINIFCILSLSSWIATKQPFFNLSAQMLMDLTNVKSSEVDIDFLVYILLGVLILKTLFPAFYAAQLESNQKKLQSYIFNIQVAVNTILLVYVLTYFFQNHLNNIFLHFTWIHVALPWLLIFLGGLMIIQIKTNDNFFKSMLFIYNVIFISAIILITPINTKMVYLFTAHFLVLFAIINVINEILKNRFGSQPLWAPIGLKKTMPKFFLLLTIWVVVVCGFPWSGGNLVKMFYISKLAGQSLLAVYFLGIFVFMHLLLFIPFILCAKRNKNENDKQVIEKVSDINKYEFGILTLLITAELLLGVGGQHF